MRHDKVIRIYFGEWNNNCVVLDQVEGTVSLNDQKVKVDGLDAFFDKWLQTVMDWPEELMNLFILDGDTFKIDIYKGKELVGKRWFMNKFPSGFDAFCADIEKYLQTA